MENVVLITAGKAGKKKRDARKGRHGRGRGAGVTDWSGDGDASAVDELARDVAFSSVVLWANLVAVGIDLMDAAQVPRDIIHDVLDRLEEANEQTLSPPGEAFTLGFLKAIRSGVASND